MEKQSLSARRTWALRLGLAILPSLLLIGGLEAALRLGGFAYTPRAKTLWKPTVAGFVGTYEYYIDTLFAPPGYLWISQPNTPWTDSYGFRRPEIPFAKPPGKIRVAFLGGSTTHGGYRPYPERAIRILNEVAGEPRYEMLNVACSSYSTHQSLLALERWALPRKPDLVFVYHGWNDSNMATGDGYCDHEKDLLLRSGEKPIRLPPAFFRLRAVQLIGRLRDRLDRTWPRIRVPLPRFRRNMAQMADRCAAAGAKMILMIRPVRAKEYIKPETLNPDELEGIEAQRDWKTLDRAEAYAARGAAVQQAQHDVAREKNLPVCDGAGLLTQLDELRAQGHFGPDVEIFREDHCHLYEIGEELLAQKVAATLAPERADDIARHVRGAEYNLHRTREFLAEDQPFEAVIFARQALAAPDLANDRAMEIYGLIAQAERQYEFVRNFRAGRWGGTETNGQTRIELLRRCLAERPSDLGVMLQIARVCQYSDRLPAAADALQGFQPATAEHRFVWLDFLLASHVAGGRAEPAHAVAAEIIALQPQHPLARQVLGMP